MHRLLVPAVDLLLGTRCAGCGGPALLLCRACAEAVRPEPVVTWPDPVPPALRHPTPVVPVAAGAHADVLRRVVVAWKEQGATRLTDVLAHHLAASVAAHDRGRAVVLVPVPTTARSRRARGCDLVDDLARDAARRLRRVGTTATVVQALAVGRPTRDQSDLGARDRAANVAGAFRPGRRALPAGHDVVVVDDVLTTGSTVTEAVRVLTAAGHRPRGIAVVAATPRIPGPRR